MRLYLTVTQITKNLYSKRPCNFLCGQSLYFIIYSLNLCHTGNDICINLICASLSIMGLIIWMQLHLERMSQQGLFRRCFVYPVGVLVLVLVTGVVVVLVVFNTLKLISGFKALPLVTSVPIASTEELGVKVRLIAFKSLITLTICSIRSYT